jgi:O-antigen ligase
MAAAWITWKILSPRRREPARVEIRLLLVFLVYAVAAMFWAPNFGRDYLCVYTGMNLVLWTIFGLALMDLPRSQRFERLSFAWILGIGGILMAVSIGQAVPKLAVHVFKVMKMYEGEYNRNIFGSLIGHNTGVASICVGPFFFALGSVFLARRWTQRILFSCYVLVSAYFFLITQSRAIWVFLVVLTPLFLLGLRPVIGAPIRLRHFLIGLLIALILISTQAISFRWNFLNIQHRDYLARIRSLTPQVLVKGTRLRIIAVSLPLVAQRPVFGHGLASFPVLYPPAQADYFAKYPDSLLQPVISQTDVAHNDYLQLVVETGIVGLGLALLTLCLFLRRSLIRFRKLQSREEKLRRYCAFFAILSLCLHGLVDFPFHIAPLALFFWFYVTMLYGASGEEETVGEEAVGCRLETGGQTEDEQLLQPQSSIPNPQSPIPNPQSPSLQPQVSSLKPGAYSLQPTASHWRTLRPGRVLVLVVILVVWILAVVPIPYSPVGFTARRLLADRLFATGAQFFYTALELGKQPGQKEAQKTEAQIRCFQAARRYFRESYVRMPLEQQTLQYLGQCDTNLASLYATEAIRARAGKDLARSREFYQRSLISLKSSIGDIKAFTQMARPSVALKPFDLEGSEIGPRLNHVVLENLAGDYLILSDLQPDDPDAARLAYGYLREAVRYCPALWSAYEGLFTLMNRKNLGNAGERQFYIRQMAARAPDAFRDYHLRQAQSLINSDRAGRAAELLMLALRTIRAPDQFPDLVSAPGWIYVRSAPDAAKLQEFVGFVKYRIPDYPDLPAFEAILLAMQHRYTEAGKAVESLVREKKVGGAFWDLLRAELLAQQGHADEGRDIFRQAASRLPFPSEAYRTRGHVRRALGLPGWEEDYVMSVSAFPSEFEYPAMVFALLKAQAARGDWQAFERTRVLAERRLADNPAVPFLVQQLRTQPDAHP